MKPFEKYPVCGGELEDKQVEKLLRTKGGQRLFVFDAVIATGKKHGLETSW